MAVNFEVRTDNSNRILGFSPSGSEELIGIGALAEYEGERIVHKSEEYELDGHGNLIHPDVEVPGGVSLGYGVLLGAGVKFSDDSAPRTFIGNSVLMPGNTRIGRGVNINDFAIIRASIIGDRNTIGHHVRIGEDTSTGNEVALFPSVKVGKRVSIGSNTMLKRNVRIPDDARIGSKVFMAHNTRLTPPPYAKSGASMFVADGVRIETPRRKITSDVRESILADA